MPKVFYHSVERLGTPFFVADEYRFRARAEQDIIENRLRKVIFVLEGSCRVEVRDGGRLFGTATVAPGDIFVIPHVCRQMYCPLNPDANEETRMFALRLAFDPEVVPPLRPGRRATLTGDPETDITVFAQQNFAEFRHLPGGQKGEVRETLDQLRREAEQRLPGYQLRAHALCISLTLLVARKLNAPRGSAPASTKSALRSAASGPSPLTQRAHRTRQAQWYIQERLHETLTLAQIAGHVQVSEEHLARVFKQVTGQTLGQYARQARLERAKTFLVSTNHTISEIAGMTGFSSVALFSRSFHQQVGVSPSAYRHRLLSDPE